MRAGSLVAVPPGLTITVRLPDFGKDVQIDGPASSKTVDGSKEH